AGAALPGLAVPTAREVGRRRGLDLVDGVEDDHPLGDLRLVVPERPAGAVAAPDAEGGLHFVSSITCWRSGRTGTSGTCAICIHPSGARRTTTLTRPNRSDFDGKSSRNCAPRLSFRSRPERATASETVRRFSRSIAVCQPGLYSRLPETPA